MDEQEFPQAPNLMAMLGLFGEANLGKINSKRFQLNEWEQGKREYLREVHLREVYLNGIDIGYLKFFVAGDKSEWLEYVGELPHLGEEEVTALKYDLSRK